MRVFARKGFAAYRVEDVVAEAGIAKGSVYLCFDSRDALLTGLFESYRARSGEVLAALGEGPALERLARPSSRPRSPCCSRWTRTCPRCPRLSWRVVAFDLFGGAVVNATDAAKRWCHRPGRTSRHHLTFVALHVQPYLLAVTVPGFTWAAAAVIHGSALVGAVLVTVAPTAVRRLAAFAVTAFALRLITSVVTVSPGLGWFAPLLFVKVLLAHLLPEAPHPAP